MAVSPQETAFSFAKRAIRATRLHEPHAFRWEGSLVMGRWWQGGSTNRLPKRDRRVPTRRGRRPAARPGSWRLALADRLEEAVIVSLPDQIGSSQLDHMRVIRGATLRRASLARKLAPLLQHHRQGRSQSLDCERRPQFERPTPRIAPYKLCDLLQLIWSARAWRLIPCTFAIRR